MRGMLIAAVAATALAAQTAGAAPALDGDGTGACVREAESAFETAWRREPSLRVIIEGHRARMAALCRQRPSDAKQTQALLQACLTEAARGPRHIQRGRNMDRDHAGRQQDLCRKLAAAL